MLTKVSIIIYTSTAILMVLKALNEIEWSWWAVLSVLIVYEVIGFVSGFINALKNKK